MGKVLPCFSWRRGSFIVSSKVFGGTIGNPGPTYRCLSGKHVFEACHQATLAIACSLKNPNVSTVITGASREQQVHGNMTGAEAEHTFSDGVMQRIGDIFDNKPDLTSV